MVYNSELICGRRGLETLSFLSNIPLNVGNLSLFLRLGCHPTKVLGKVVE